MRSRPLATALIGGLAAVVFASPAAAQGAARKMKTSPPKIEAAILCENPFEWTLSLSIAGEREIAFFALQPKGTFGVTATVIAEPGHKNVAWSLPGNSVGRSLLILAADVEGNAAKVVVDVAQTHCGAQPSPQ